jgi:N-methylhydantoinase A
VNDRVARIGVDIGGTFTDVAAVDAEGSLHVGKRLTSHGAEHDAVVGAVADTDIVLADSGLILAHGTTLVINSLIERKGARVGLVTTLGFADVIETARGNRPEVFNLFYRRDPPLVPPSRRFEIDERVHASGEIVRRPSDRALEALAAQLRRAKVASVAVAFLNSYVQPENERAVAEYLRGALPDVRVTISSDLSREWREYERTSTAVANAYVTPVADRYIDRLLLGLGERGFTGEFVMLDSNGGALTADVARRFSIRAVESGPVAGVLGARDLAESHSITKVVTFDMGGTTAKGCVIEDGLYASTDLYFIGGYERGFPLQVRTVAVTEVGAGGGSIASVDEIGRLRVGPRSAGSQPGPACYGFGGTEPTVTDANLYCGRIAKDHFVGSLQLDEQAAALAIERLASVVKLTPHRLALGILKLANLSMAALVRRQTLERGRDPRDFTLIAYGGAGPMHACEVAAEVGIGRVLIPVFPGHFSAIGMLGANLRLDRSEVLGGRLKNLDVAHLRGVVARISSEFAAQLVLRATAAASEVRSTYSLAIRYVGQDHTLMVANPAGGDAVPAEIADLFRQSFEKEYEQRYGHLNHLAELEVVEVEVVVERVLPKVEIGGRRGVSGETAEIESYFDLDGRSVTSRVIPRSGLEIGETFEGPMIVYEEGATSVISPGARGVVADDGTLLVKVRPALDTLSEDDRVGSALVGAR